MTTQHFTKVSNKFSKRLLELIEEKELSQRKFAAQIAVTPACVTYWLQGEKQPTADNIIMICNTFAISADYLLGITDY